VVPANTLVNLSSSVCAWHFTVNLTFSDDRKIKIKMVDMIFDNKYILSKMWLARIVRI
jgi:hypothetical protein